MESARVRSESAVCFLAVCVAGRRVVEERLVQEWAALEGIPLHDKTPSSSDDRPASSLSSGLHLRQGNGVSTVLECSDARQATPVGSGLTFTISLRP